ncbi:MAG: transposase family protein [Roseiflexus sp.]
MRRTTICGRSIRRGRAPWFRRFLDLPNAAPSHDTFSRVFAALDPHAVAAGLSVLGVGDACLHQWRGSRNRLQVGARPGR